MMPLRNVTYTLLLTGVLALQSGCGDVMPDRNDENGMRTETNRLGQLSMRSPNGGVARVNRDQLTRIAEQVPGVEQAVLAMNDKDVVIGIKVDNAGKRRIVEKQVYSQLLWQYPEYEYFVTSDEALFDRVRTANKNQTVGQYHTKSVTSDNEIKTLADEITRAMVKP
ncbi:YhcN/YlaJ family sporulation lipoprotein [Paenibacillus sp. LHD-117]|uniref:YhcN/YlaJ family sporulation lipoprotein n=1 Tax=Paenibacillus sp. LHD-117 TaxID=3071412 RepID=UPI0027E0F8D2|nr:YhcN/YlaJ family sporulation lipoprotein [Paenibacillus sp. LHD-117]MDQ6419957.1 YhcN/YlaJ family sporulation lipoprotein [Paenibacillus sp. LHD-117]